MTLTARATDVRLDLAPEPHSAGRARHALVDAGLDRDLDHAVCLLTTELVTNSVRHASHGGTRAVRLHARLAEGYALVEVADPGPGFDPGVRHDAKGFGLRLVDTLATRWGTDSSDGCRTWFEVDRRRRRFDRT